jgi:hypothetical protein
MGDIAASSPRNADFGKGIAGRFQQDDLGVGMRFGTRDRAEESRRPSTNDNNVQSAIATQTRFPLLQIGTRCTGT